MKWLKHRSLIIISVVVLFLAGILLHSARIALYYEDWATYPTNKHIFDQGLLVKAGEITDSKGTVLAYTENETRKYNSNADIRKATVHTVGDLKGFVSTGMQSAYLSTLAGYDLVNGVFNVSGKGNNIALTLDSSLCVSATKALGSRSGTVGIYNYKTGEIVCIANTPTFDPIEVTAPRGDGVYVNRFLSGVYAPGSIFKLVTTLSALENTKAEELCFSCNYGVDIMGEKLTCMGMHGDIKIEKALVHSCNAFFAQTALTLGRSTLTKTAEKVGFNKTLKMDGIECAQSKYNVSEANDIDFGWSGIGQQNDLVNPYQYLSFVGAIANDGEGISPFVINKITSPKGVTIKSSSKSKTTLMSKENAQKLKTMMRSNVKENYGDYRFPGLEVCGKTGTAEIGKNATPHSLFVGLIDSEDKPYAFIVVVENSGAGSGTALSVASKVLAAL